MTNSWTVFAAIYTGLVQERLSCSFGFKEFLSSSYPQQIENPDSGIIPQRLSELNEKRI